MQSTIRPGQSIRHPIATPASVLHTWREVADLRAEGATTVITFADGTAITWLTENLHEFFVKDTASDLVVVVDGGDTLTVIRNGLSVGTFERVKLKTAWLLRLEHTNPIALAAALRRDHGFLDSIVYAKAADVLVRAGVTI